MERNKIPTSEYVSIINSQPDYGLTDSIIFEEKEERQTTETAEKMKKKFLRKGSIHPKLSDEDLLKVYKFVDQMPTERVKRNMGRDFADCSYAA